MSFGDSKENEDNHVVSGKTKGRGSQRHRHSASKFGKKIFSCFCTLVLVISLAPTAAVADIGSEASTQSQAESLTDGSTETSGGGESGVQSTSDSSAAQTDGSQSDSAATKNGSTQNSGESSSSQSSSSSASTGGSSSSSASTSNSSSSTEANSSFLGVADNDNELADVRDISNGGADNLTCTVTSGNGNQSQLETGNGKYRTLGNWGDGTYIGYTYIGWMLKDTDTGSTYASLTKKPTDNSEQTFTAQIEFALYGEHDYGAGDITVKIPAHIFKDRNGNYCDNLVLPLAEAPSTRTEFNWSFVDDENGGYYILTNTRDMSAATQVSIQLSYENVLPSEVVDMQDSSPLTATVNVITNAGNTLDATSNSITARVDTHEEVTSANKYHYNYRTYSAAELEKQGVTIPDEYKDETKFLVATWCTYAYHTGNTNYSMSWTDSPSTTMTEGGETVPCNSFIVSGESGTEESNVWKRDNTTQYEYVKVAYPFSQFKADTSYELSNDATWTCVQTDDGTTTTASNSAKFNFFYHTPQGVYPSGHFYHEKWGADDNSYYTTHTDYGSRAGINGWTGCWGIYPDALNKIAYKNTDVNADFVQYIRGYLLPWTEEAGADGKDIEDFGKNDVTMTIEDGDLTYKERIDSDEIQLKVGEDFDFNSLHLVRPTIWKAVEYDASDVDQNQVVYDNGQKIWTGNANANGGTYGVGYVKDSDYTHIPVFTVEALDSNGNVISTQEVDWTDGASTKDVALPSDTAKYRVSVTAGKDDDGDGEFVAAIADAYVIPSVTLHPTEKVKEIAQSALENQTSPTTFLTNSDEMTATQDGDTIFTMDGSGTDRLCGYSELIKAIPSKDASQTVDYDNQVVRIQYSSKVREISNVNDLDIWKNAVENGDIPADTSCTWYDLLPKGVTPDISTVKMRAADSITDVYTIQDYKGTGRTLLVVKADLTPMPFRSYQDSQVGYVEDDPYITFEATYPFDLMRDYGNELHNVISYESGNDVLGTVENYAGEPDSPDGNNTVTQTAFADDTEKAAMTDLDSTTDKPAFVYAGASTEVSNLNYTVAELSKKVMVNNDGYWGTGVTGSHGTDDKELVAYTGGDYMYRLSATASLHTEMSGIVLYDKIDGYVPSSDKADYGDTQWKGTLASVDVSSLERMGIDPVVYYSTSDIPIESTDNGKDRTSEAGDLGNTDIWSTTPPDDMSKVTVVAIDCSKKADGTDFVLEPGGTVSAYLNMIAPSNDEAQQYIAKSAGGSSSDPDGAHAYNNVYMYCTAADSTTGGTGTTTGLLRHDYTKVGLKNYDLSVTKTWDDSDDNDGIRPSSVTVHLYQNGVDTGKAVTLDGTADSAGSSLSYESEAWVATFKGLAYRDSSGTPYHYTFVEDVPEGYSQGISYNSDGTISLINKHVPDTVEVSGSKTWAEDTPDLRPSSVTVTLMRDGNYYKSKTIRADESGNWNYSFTGLPRYHDQGVEYNYTVLEFAEDYNSSVTSTEDSDGNVTANIVNTYHPYGDLNISKTVENTTSACDGQEFSFTINLANADGSDFLDQVSYKITDADGNEVSTGTFSNGQTIKIQADQTATLIDLPKGTTYKVVEEDTPGYNADTDSASGKIYSNRDNTATFNNVYKTKGAVSFSASKKLSGAPTKANMFRFELRDSSGNMVAAATNDADGAVRFGAIKFDGDDNGKTYTYTISETNGGMKGMEYDSTVYTATVTPVDNGDGTMTCTAVYTDADGNQVDTPTFSNSYTATGSTSFTAFKKFKSGDALTAGEFTFSLYDEDGNKLYLDENGGATTTVTDTPLQATNDADGDIQFPTIKYTQDDLDNGDGTFSDKTFIYAAKEDVPEGAVLGSDGYYTVDGSDIEYTSAVFYYRVIVSGGSDGELGIDSSNVYKSSSSGNWYVDNDVPTFVNKKAPGSLAIQKFAVDNTGNGYNPNQKFTFKIKLTAPEGESIPYYLDYTITDAQNTTTAKSTFLQFDNEDEAVAAPSGGKALATSNVVGDSVDTQVNSGSVSSSAESSDAAEVSSEAAVDSAEDCPDYMLSVRNPETLEVERQVSKEGEDSGDGTLRATATTMSGTVGSKLSPLSTDAGTGTAYAVLLDSDVTTTTGDTYEAGTLLFIRSTQENVTTDTAGQTITDCENNTYSGTIYTGFENNYYYAYTWGNNMPGWHTRSDDVKRVVIKDKLKPNNTAWWFSNLEEIKTVEGLENIDTSNVRSMQAMFRSCRGITSLDVSSFDTSNVTSMEEMFYECYQLKSIDLTNWDTSKVREMDWMFEACWNIKSITFGEKFDTSSVTDMCYMFRGDGNLENLDVSHFNTKNVRSMGSMFYGCHKLKEIDVSNWDVSNVRAGWYMGGFDEMFQGCSGVTQLDVSKWDTHNALGMNRMFAGCSGLTSIDLSSFDTSNVSFYYWYGGMEGMFMGCSGLTSLDLSNFDTSNVTAMNEMFYGCSGLTSLDLSNFDTSKVEGAYYGGGFDRMFKNCKSLETLNLSNFDTSKVCTTEHTSRDWYDYKGKEGMREMFSGCTSLDELDISSFDTSTVQSMK
ncbi:MAG: BspA family leucine-rich repeat surface protein, partial [Coriobacteriales bacterium]